jgi:hypothetical protein
MSPSRWWKYLPNRNYDRGRAKEYRVAKKLRGEGWTVLRMAGSHGVFDLVALKLDHLPLCEGWNIKLGDIRLIQCKSGKSKERMIKDVLKSDIKRFEGLYSVSVEVL